MKNSMSSFLGGLEESAWGPNHDSYEGEVGMTGKEFSLRLAPWSPSGPDRVSSMPENPSNQKYVLYLTMDVNGSVSNFRSKATGMEKEMRKLAAAWTRKLEDRNAVGLVLVRDWIRA